MNPQFNPLFTTIFLFFVILSTGFTGDKESISSPNFIIIFSDDLGYGDLGTFGHPTIKTPNLDKMAAEGQKWTNFYAAASVCTPSRAGLLTGRLPARSGMASNHRRVLFPDSREGIPEDEITIAELLKQEGYTTACIGKWHLGHLDPYLPTNNGFDYYFGIPYSNDMDRVHDYNREHFLSPRISYWNVPLMMNEKIIQRPADQTTITKRYTEETVRFIRDNKSEPFFIYLAHSMPHVPLFASQKFAGKSFRGLFGDVVEEIDWGVGEIIRTLYEEKLAENTMVVFTSDNGPWLSFNEQGGSAGLLHGGKGMTWEGGMREPTIFWWPGKIETAVISEIGSTLDLLPTLTTLAGSKIPDDRILDGFDLQQILLGSEKSPREVVYYYRGTELYALRKGPFKAHFITEWAYANDNKKTIHDLPLLYNLDVDPSEQYNIAANHPDVLTDIEQEVITHQAKMEFGPDRLVGRIEKSDN
jgi:arylsulfatase A-like enzyme